MDLLALIKTRRSIRKYTDEQVSREDLEKVLEAGLYAANAGGAQRSMVVAVDDADLTKRLGRMNMAGFNRAGLIGSYVSHEQPSVIDDPSIKDGFYGAPSVLCVFCQERFAFSVTDAFCIAQTMTLEAHSLGLGSCIVSRAETTFLSPEGQKKSSCASGACPKAMSAARSLSSVTATGPTPRQSRAEKDALSS